MFQTLLVPVDGSEFSERSIPLAHGLARAASATLRLVRVQEPMVPGGFLSSGQFRYQGLDLDAYAVRHREEASARLDQLARRLSEDGVRVEAAVIEGRVVDSLAADIDASGADVVVMTTHGRSGTSRMWLGSVADGLVRHVHVPLLLVHPGEDDETAIEATSIRRILVALDGSELAESVLEPARDLANATGAELVLGHVLASTLPLGGDTLPLLPDDAVRVREEAEGYLENVAERLRGEGVSAEVRLIEGDSAGSAIPELAKQLRADVIALATHGYGGVRRMVLGSVADKVLRSSHLPLLVLRPRAS